MIVKIFLIFIYNFVSILLNEKKLNQKSTPLEVMNKFNLLQSSAQAGHLSIRHKKKNWGWKGSKLKERL